MAESRGPELQRAAIAFYVVACGAVLLRCYVRTRIVKQFGVDDWFMLAAIICFTLFIVCVLLGIRYGTGQHMWDLTPENATKALMFWWFCAFGYCSTMITSKISISCFLLRITNRKLDIWILYTIMTITALSGIVYFFVTMFQCQPVPYAWDKDQRGTCLSVGTIMTFTWIYSILNIIVDLALAILPCVLVWNLQMRRKSKVALVPVLTIACIASAAIIVRFAYIDEFSDPDFLWATIDIAIWSTVEQSLAITAGSLATLTPLFRVIVSRIGTLTQRSLRTSKSGPQLTEGSQPPAKEELPRLSKAVIKGTMRESLGYAKGEEGLEGLFDDEVWRRDSCWEMTMVGSESDEEGGVREKREGRGR